MNEVLTVLIDWVRANTLRARGLLVPVSGGSDSALCFWLCCQALPGKVTGIHAGTALRAREWFERCGSIEILPEPAAEPDDRDLARWSLMLSLSRRRGHWLVGTRNRTEEVFGTYSIASRLATFLPLAGLWKSQVIGLCQALGVPDEVIASSSRADPDCGRPLELAAIPLHLIDLFLRHREGEITEHELTALDEAQHSYLDKIYRYNLFKRQLPARGPGLSLAGMSQPMKGSEK